MNEDFDGRIDDQLRRTGEIWRARHPVPAARIDRSLFVDRRERSFMPALASAVGVLALVIVAVLVVLSLPPSDRNVAVGSPSPSPSGPIATATPAGVPSPTPAPDPSRAPVETVVSDGIEWTRSTATMSDIEVVENITIVDGRFLAQGYRCMDPTDTDCWDHAREYLLLESVDGVQWRDVARIEMEPGVLTGSFVQTDTGYLFHVGFGYRGPGAGLWHSMDGSSWEWLGGQEAFGQGCGTAPDSVAVHDVHRTAGAYFAWGMTYCRSTVVDSSWTSVDGLEWQASAEVHPGGIVGGDGVFVRGTDEGIMSSTDGLNWTLVAETRNPPEVVAIGGGFVAVTTDTTNGLIHELLTSTDGTEWVSHGFTTFAAVRLTSLNSDASRAVALETPNDRSGAPAVWISSTDGTTWHRHALPDTSSNGPEVASVAGDRVTVIDNVNFANAVLTTLVADIP